MKYIYLYIFIYVVLISTRYTVKWENCYYFMRGADSWKFHAMKYLNCSWHYNECLLQKIVIFTIHVNLWFYSPPNINLISHVWNSVLTFFLIFKKKTNILFIKNKVCIEGMVYLYFLCLKAMVQIAIKCLLYPSWDLLCICIVVVWQKVVPKMEN